MNTKTRFAATALAVTLTGLAALAARSERPPRRAPAEGAKLHRFSTTVERERPTLDEETKRLISDYRRDPSEANRAALERKVRENYDKVIARKKAKLEELKKTARHESKIKEMEEIVREVIADKENRVARSMRRFTDPRLRPGAREAADGYHPLIGGGANVFIAHAPVTNAEYAKFLKETGRKPPRNWSDGICPTGKESHPVVWVSRDDAVAYCDWLSRKDASATYRLPTEEEWEIAAGHMPKDADFNCKDTHPEIADKKPHAKKLPIDAVYTTPVDAYKATLSACGAVDMWGNCWEWTATEITATNGAERGKKAFAVKGGSWYANRMSCRTELRGEGRNPHRSYNSVGFRVVKEVR